MQRYWCSRLLISDALESLGRTLNGTFVHCALLLDSVFDASKGEVPTVLTATTAKRRHRLTEPRTRGIVYRLREDMQ